MVSMSNSTPNVDALVSPDEPEYDAERRLCGSCAGKLEPSFYTVNGRHVCEACWAEMEGSALRPMLYGLIAAALCTGLYYVVYTWLGGFRLMVVPILAGVFVGTAVRRGSGLLPRPWLRVYSMAMTYVATTLTYVHTVMSQSSSQSLPAAVVASLAMPFAMVVQMRNVVTLVLLALGLHEAYAFSVQRSTKIRGPFDSQDGDILPEVGSGFR